MNELFAVLIVVVVLHPFCFGWKSLFRVHRFVPRPLVDNRRPSSTDEYLMKKRFQKLTKQVATIGPSSLNLETVEKMFLSGADVFRINLSHGEHHEKGAAVDMVREVEKKYNRPIAVIADLQGPRLRLGSFENEKVTVVDNQQFVFDLNEELGSAYRVRLPHPELLKSLKIGEVLLVDDGKIRLEVVNNSFLDGDATRDVNPGPALDPATSCQEVSPRVTCKVLVGGVLSDKKGVNAPDTVLPISSLTPKDKRDLKFALEKNVDWVALSFVQRPEDILELRSLTGDQVKIMSKLEKPSAISQHLEKIIALSDGIMVARGDLGIECPPWDVPVLQKRIVQKCKEFGKPVIVATQMLDSMIDHPVPTRAEASDCATAIYDTSDAVMLSGESAAGRYPVDAVKMQLNIITSVENDDFYRRNLGRFAKELSSKGGFTFPEKQSSPRAALLGDDESMLMQENVTPLPDDVSTVANINEPCSVATTLAARQVAEISGSEAILTITKTGSIVHRISRLRPNVPIIAACYNERVARYLSLLWGVYPVVLTPPAEEFHFTTEMERACKAACALGFCDPNKDFLTVIAGLPFGIPHTTNFIRVCSAAGPRSWPSPLPNGRLRDETSTSDVA